MDKWKTGWGNGLTGPTCPWPENAFAGGKDWPHTIIRDGMECIAIIPAPESRPHAPIGKCGSPDIKELEARTTLIADAPLLAERVEELESINAKCTLARSEAEREVDKLAEQNADMLDMIKIWESIVGPPMEPTWNSIRKEMRELIARTDR